MTGRRRATAVSIVVIAAGLGALSACKPLDYGCQERDEKLASILNRLAIIDTYADEAVLLNGHSSCDPDDVFASAVRHYRADLGRTDVLSFYRAATDRDGWYDEGGSPASPEPAQDTSCYSKAVAGTTAYLRVWFPGDPTDASSHSPRRPAASPSRHALYAVEVTAAYNGVAGC